MSALTAAFVLQLAASCQHIVAPETILKIATHESGLDPAAVHVNHDGSRDRGLMQINDKNDGWLGLVDPFDPCQSIAAGAKVLTALSRYNIGSPTKGLDYAQAVQAVRTDPGAPEPVSPAPERDIFTHEARDAGGELLFSRE